MLWSQQEAVGSRLLNALMVRTWVACLFEEGQQRERGEKGLSLQEKVIAQWLVGHLMGSVALYQQL